MRTISAVCLLLSASSARAQFAAERIVSAPAALSAPAAVSAAAAFTLGAPAALAPALAAPAFAPSPSASALVPALSAPALAAAAPAAAPALAAAPFAAAAAGPEKTKDGSGEHAAAALSEFSKLVAELMSGDGARASAAADALNKIKEAHLNEGSDLKSDKILDLKPMQIPAGMIEVLGKADDLRGMKAKDADKWLREKAVPYVTDYKGRKRPVDHHHESRAAWETGREEVYTRRYFDDELHAQIKALNRDEFYAVTRAMGLFYDRDQFGAGPHDPNHLPEDVRGLADDPYRSLAGEVRKRGGYEKTAVPFAEFKWANFFRERLKTYPTKADFDKAVAEAMRLVADPAAKDLPGYKTKK
jgi:hypothetical protein